LFKFDVSQLPAGAIINSVSVRLTVAPQLPGGGPTASTFDLHRVLQAWTETQVTWNSRLAGTPWSSPGARGASDSASQASASVPVSGAGNYTFASTSSLVADVQAWVGHPENNFGWLLQSENETSPKTARHFATREYGNPSGFPSLTIDYSIASLSILTQPQSQDVQVGSTVTFSVTANGTPPLTYQWRFNSNPLTGATNSTLVLNQVQLTNSGGYSVVVTDSTSSTNSQTATLTVSPLPVGQALVSVTSPTNGAHFPAHAGLLLQANAVESNGVIARVEFFLGTNSVGTATNRPFSLVASNLAAGTYQLTARATDDRGTNTTSQAITFTVHNPPQVTLRLSPANTNLPLGTGFTNTATIDAGAATITNVLFFEGQNLLGQTAAPPFVVLWQPAAPQLYSVSAVAIDEFGQMGTSAPIVIRLFVPDGIPPSVTIRSSPPNFARLTSPLVSLAGTAADNIGVDHVEVQVNSGSFVRVTGTNAWSAQISLAAGNNIVRVRSVDLAGNNSLVATRFFTFVSTTTLTITINGSGTVSPNLNGRSLEIGRVFTVAARAGAGQQFAGWSGGLSNANPRLSFQMVSNLVLVANFVPNPFLPFAGPYLGLFFNTNAVSSASSGSINLQLGRQGAFSGKLSMNGASYAFRSQFNSSGAATLGVLRHGLVPVALVLQLDLTSGEIRGTATDESGTAVLLANRGAFTARYPAAQAGQRSFVLRHTAADGGAIAATITAKIGPLGAVRLQGSLADGRKFTLATALWSDGQVPFYLSLARGKDVLLGFLRFADNPTGAVDGTVFWTNTGSTPFVTQLEPAAGSP
jgi:hypothetical protein